jgi:hypothetical protein
MNYSEEIRTGRPGIDFRGGGYFLLFSTEPILTGSGVHPAKWALSLGGKRLESEADHSPPSSPELKNGGVISPLSARSSWRDA